MCGPTGLSCDEGCPNGFENKMNAIQLSDAERTTLKNVMRLMDAFRAVRPTMPLQHAYAFLLVAMEEGLGVMDYAERAGVKQDVMTRHLLDLGSHTRTRHPGLGLLAQRIDPMDMRRHQTFLTPNGRTLLHKVIRSAR